MLLVCLPLCLLLCITAVCKNGCPVIHYPFSISKWQQITSNFVSRSPVYPLQQFAIVSLTRLGNAPGLLDPNVLSWLLPHRCFGEKQGGLQSPTSGKAGGLERGTAQSGLAPTIHPIVATVQFVGLPSLVLGCTYEPFLHRVPRSKHNTLVPKNAAPQSSSASPHNSALSLSHFCL